MWCVIGFSIFIAAEFDWKVNHESPELTLAQAIYHKSGKGPHFIIEMKIELTLSKRPVWVPYDPLKGWMPHERFLADGAFQPRTCTFRLEQGVFPKPFPDGHNFAYRMAFLDRSPYPGAESWQLRFQYPAMSVERWTEFHSGDLGTYYDKSWLENNCIVT